MGRSASSSGYFHMTSMFILSGMLFCLLLPSPVTLVTEQRQNYSMFSSSQTLANESSSTERSTVSSNHRNPLTTLLSYFQPTTSTSLTTSLPAPSTSSDTTDRKLCPHILLISAARHGSTWFVDSVERCSFSAISNGTSYGRLNMFTELWMTSHVKGPLVNMTTEQAVDYVTSILSMKIFPAALVGNNDAVQRFIRGSASRNVPIVVLRRDLVDAFRSTATAFQQNEWNAVNTNPLNEEGDDDQNEDSIKTNSTQRDQKQKKDIKDLVLKLPGGDLSFESYREGKEQYFKDMLQFLDNEKIGYDTVQYEKARLDEFIHLQSAGCYVRNCNVPPSR